MSKASPETALQGLSPDGLHIFSAKIEFNDFGLKLAKSPQTGTQSIKIKSSVKSQAKDYKNSSLDPWAAVVNLVFGFLGSATVLKQEKAGLSF